MATAPRVRASPHRIVTLRAADMALDRSEIEVLCAPLGVSPEYVTEIERVTHGWPIGVLTLCRFAVEGRLESSLERLDDVAFEEMRSYLLDEVFESLSAAELSALIACAGIRGATADDIAAALGIDDVRDLLTNVLAASPFVSQPSGLDLFEVHPLLQAAVKSRYRRRCQQLARTLRRPTKSVERLFGQRASIAIWVTSTRQRVCWRPKICARIGNNRSATARSLRQLMPKRLPDIRLFAAYRATAGVSAWTRTSCVKKLRQSGRRFPVARTSSCAAISAIHSLVSCTKRAAFEEAEALLRLLEWEVGGIPDIPRSAGEAYIARTLACIYARLGRLAQAEGYFRKGYFAIPGSELVASRYLIERSIIERLHGRHEERNPFS